MNNTLKSAAALMRQPAMMEELLNDEGGLDLGLVQEDFDILLTLAHNSLRFGDVIGAKKIYLSLIVCQPGRYDYYQGFGNLCLQARDFRALVRVAAAMVTLDPINPLGYYFSAVACFELGYLVEAQEDVAESMARAAKIRDLGMQDDCRRLMRHIDIAKRNL